MTILYSTPITHKNNALVFLINAKWRSGELVQFSLTPCHIYNRIRINLHSKHFKDYEIKFDIGLFFGRHTEAINKMRID